MELIIGSNIIRNTNGILNVQGKEQIFLEISVDDNQLLLTMDIYDEKGNHIAKLRRNAWAFNERDRFEITTNPASLKLIDKETSDVVVEANVLEIDRISIPHGKFYTHTGVLITITPEFWRILGLTMGGNIFESCGGAVAIG